MPIWTTLPVAEQPSIRLLKWRIFQTETGELHFVGYHPEGYEGRVSPAIQNFDPVTQRGVTLSGRIYELVEYPGYDEDGLYVWEMWCRANGVKRVMDVTEEVAAGLQAFH